MSLGEATLGCAPDCVFAITSSCGSDPLFTINDVISYKWNRVLDRVSDGRITFAANVGCNRLLDFICEGRHHLTFIRNGCVEWSGPIRRTEFADDEIILYASDPLWWTKRRVAPPFFAAGVDGVAGDVTGRGYLNPADYFVARVLDLFSLSVDEWGAANNLPGGGYDSGLDGCDQGFAGLCFDNIYADKTPLPDGVIEILTSNSTKFTTVYKILEELGRSVIDFTVVGKDLLFGYPSTPLPESRRQPLPYLSNDSWCNPPRIVRDISSLSNEVFVNTGLGAGSADSIIEDIVYENGTVRVQECGFNKHGLHQTVLDRTSISSVDEAIAAGRSILDHNSNGQSIAYIENTRSTQLADSVAWDLPRMVPGQRVKVDIDKFGLKVNEEMRLHEVIVSGSTSDKEVVKVTLEPLGTG